MLEIKEVFIIRGRGIMVIPVLPPPISFFIKPVSDKVVVQRLDGTNKEFIASFQIEHFSLVGSHGKFSIVALFPTASLEDFPKGSKLLISDKAEATLCAAINS